MLSDEKKRRQYDQFGEEGLKGEGGFRGGSFNFDDFFKDFNFGNFGRGHGNKRGGGFKFSFGGGGFDDFFNMGDDDDDYYEEEEGGFGGGFGDFGDFGDSLFGHHRNNHGDQMHARQMYRESSSM